MCNSESVSRSVRVRGSCAEWLPLVRDCLSSRGFRNIAVDAGRRCLTADYGDPPVCSGISVTLAPSALCGGTDVSVVVSASLEGGCSAW